MNAPGESTAIHAHLEITARLIATCMERLRTEDFGAFQDASAAIKNGAAVRVTTELSATGLCEISAALVDGRGEIVTLAHVAFDRQSH